MNWLTRSLRRVASFVAGLLPGPPSDEAPPPDIDGVRDAQADERKTALENRDTPEGRARVRTLTSLTSLTRRLVSGSRSS